MKIDKMSSSKDFVIWKRQLKKWRLAIDCKKIFAKHISDKWLASRMYKENLELKKNNSNFFKKGKRFKTDTSLMNDKYKHINRCSTSLPSNLNSRCLLKRNEIGMSIQRSLLRDFYIWVNNDIKNLTILW